MKDVPSTHGNNPEKDMDQVSQRLYQIVIVGIAKELDEVEKKIKEDQEKEKDK